MFLGSDSEYTRYFTKSRCSSDQFSSALPTASPGTAFPTIPHAGYEASPHPFSRCFPGQHLAQIPRFLKSTIVVLDYTTVTQFVPRTYGVLSRHPLQHVEDCELLEQPVSHAKQQTARSAVIRNIEAV